MKVQCAPDRANLDDPFLAHEALDRTHVVTCIFAEHVLEHPFVQANGKLKAKAEVALEHLMGIYQSIGAPDSVATQAKEQ